MKLSKFDVSEYLTDEKNIASYLNAIIEEGDPGLLLAAIGDIAKARGMSQVASDSGLGRESLYKALKLDSKPRFETVFRVLNSLGLRIGFSADSEPKKKKAANELLLKKVKMKHKRYLRTSDTIRPSRLSSGNKNSK